MKIADDNHDNIYQFLMSTFETGDTSVAIHKEVDMFKYATLAKFLSDTTIFQSSAEDVSNWLQLWYRQFREDEGIKGSFTQALRQYAPSLGFSDHVLILNGKAPGPDFAWVVSQKCLFRDVYTRPHGEFTHAMQWLIMANMYKGMAVPDLYVRSVKYKSNKPFATGKTDEKIYLWQFLVDCFEGGGEDYRSNILCKTFRCPQYTTENLRKLSTKCWVGEFLYVRRNKGLQGSAPVPEESHYSGKREVTMKPVHLSRTLGQIENVYAKHKETVFEKMIHDEIRPDRVKWRPYINQ
jgi:hypothetical protein